MKITLCGLAAILLLPTLSGLSLAQSDPFSLTEAPFGSPAMDGDISDWMAMRNDNNVLSMSYAHGARGGNQIGEALEVNIQYAWDNTNFYFLVEEVADDDPTMGLNDVEWCRECEGGEVVDGPAPWSTDSVGFYDKGITWPGNGMPDDDLVPVDTFLLERGPYTQFWVGLPTADEIVVDDEAQNYHLTRIVSPEINEGGGMLVGNRSELKSNFTKLIPDLPALTTVQSAHGIVEDGANGGRGRRFTEAFMRWDQIRYPDPEKNDLGDPEELDEDGNLANPVAARILAINDPDNTDLILDTIKGHYVEDVGEGYEFRLEPLLVDGLSGDDDVPYPFGNQTHPNGFQDPQNHQEWDEISVVRLVAGEVVTCDPNTGGDLDGNGKVEFADFLILSGNFSKAVAGHAEGDIDCNGTVEFADFLVLSGNFGKAVGGAQSVPEPSGLALLCLAGIVSGIFRRRRR